MKRILNEDHKNLHSNDYSILEKRNLLKNFLISNNSKTLLAFLGQIEIGTPAQVIKSVLFDTGSFQCWVRSSECKLDVCKEEGMTSFNSAESNTYKDSGQLSEPVVYVDQSKISGKLVSDSVGVGNLKIMDFPFIEATFLSDNTLDGLVGMGLRSKDYPLFMNNLSNLTSEVFSYWIDENNENAELIIGGMNKNHLIGNLTWIYVNPYKKHWAAPINNSINVKNENNEVAAIKLPSNYYAVFDTGTSVNYLSLHLAKELNSYFNATVYLNESEKGGSVIYQIKCDNLYNLPEVSLNFYTQIFGNDSKDITLTFKGSDYILSFGNLCISTFFGQDGIFKNGENGILIGNALLKKFVTVFDYKNYRIGFGVSNRKKNRCYKSNFVFNKKDEVLFEFDNMGNESFYVNFVNCQEDELVGVFDLVVKSNLYFTPENLSEDSQRKSAAIPRCSVSTLMIVFFFFTFMFVC
ncbi:Vacuolar protease A [Lobulomyces angularis]|nr:Vacuolar protease A [Lobulomyces angularis]